MSTIETFAAQVARIEQLLPAIKALVFGAPGDVTLDGEIKPSLEKRFNELKDAADIDLTAAAAMISEMEGILSDANLALENAPRVRGYWPSTAAGIGLGVAGHGAITGGTGGTNGTYPLQVTGGGLQMAAQGWVLIEGGILTKVTITHPGWYTGAPTISLAGIPGLTGAAVAAVMAPNTPEGGSFIVGRQRYKVVAGAAVAEGSPMLAQEDIEDVRSDVRTGWSNTWRNTIPQVTREALRVDAAGREVMVLEHAQRELMAYGESAGVPAVRRALPSTWRNTAPGSAREVLRADAWGREVLVLDHVERRLLAYGVALGADGEVAHTSAPAARPARPLPSPPTRRDRNGFISYGQSLSVGSQGRPALSLVQPYANLTFGAGPKASKSGSVGNNPGTNTVKALVEDNLDADSNASRGETICSASANGACEYFAIENGGNPTDLVVFASAAGHGGYSLAELDHNSAWFQVFRDHCTEAKARATSAGKTYAVRYIAWLQGESDAALGTTEQAYYDGMLALHAATETWLRTNVNMDSERVVFGLYQTARFTIDSDGAIAVAQIRLCNDYPDRFRMAAPFYHLTFVDGTHLGNIGYKRLGRAFARDFKRFLVDGVYAEYIRCLSATVRGAVVTLRFDSPYPLKLDDELLAPTTNMGFRVRVAGADAVVTSVKVARGYDVEIRLATAPVAGTVEVAYAIHYTGMGATVNGATGNLRDTDPEAWRFSGVDYPMFRVCPAFRINANILEDA